jgi:hypothetical protein
MSKPMPPIPPANRSDKGPGSAPEPNTDDRRGVQSRQGNIKEQGQQANTKQNTTHQGYQQDR